MQESEYFYEDSPSPSFSTRERKRKYSLSKIQDANYERYEQECFSSARSTSRRRYTSEGDEETLDREDVEELPTSFIRDPDSYFYFFDRTKPYFGYDRLFICNTTNEKLFPVRSAFAITSGVYYYEATVEIRNWKSEMAFGWMTREKKMRSKLGRDKHSFAIFLNKMCVFHGNRKYKSVTNYTSLINLKLRGGNTIIVVGCLIDMDKKKFSFYLNGTLFENADLQNSIHFKDEPYYAAANIGKHVSCHFNFGQSRFANRPSKLQYQTFDCKTNGDIRKYQLVDYSMWNGDDGFHLWFKQPVVDNQFVLYYQSPKQSKCDNEVKQHFEGNWIPSKQISLFHSILNEFGFQRIIQSLIEYRNENESQEQLDDRTRTIALCTKSILQNKINPADERFNEFLYSYILLKHQQDDQSDISRHRIICIVLLNTIRKDQQAKECGQIIKNCQNEILQYLIYIFTKTHDNCILSYSLLSLTHLYNSKNCYTLQKQEITDVVARIDNEYKPKCIDDLKSYKYQLKLCCQKFTKKLEQFKSNSYSYGSLVTYPRDTLIKNQTAQWPQKSHCKEIVTEMQDNEDFFNSLVAYDYPSEQVKRIAQKCFDREFAQFIFNKFPQDLDTPEQIESNKIKHIATFQLEKWSTLMKEFIKRNYKIEHGLKVIVLGSIGYGDFMQTNIASESKKDPTLDLNVKRFKMLLDDAYFEGPTETFPEPDYSATIAKENGCLFINTCLSDNDDDIINNLCTVEFVNRLLAGVKGKVTIIDMRLAAFINELEIDKRLQQDREFIRFSHTGDERFRLKTGKNLHYFRIGYPVLWNCSSEEEFIFLRKQFSDLRKNMDSNHVPYFYRRNATHASHQQM